MASLNEHDLPSLIDRYQLKTFFETGTGNGEGFRYAANCGFSYMFTCDIIESSAIKAFIEWPEHTCMHSDSSDALSSFQFARKWFNRDYGNTLWWLDAHFPGVDTDTLDWNTSISNYGATNPAKSELDTIMEGQYENDVILIDDAFLYRAGLIGQRLSDRVPECYESLLGSLEQSLDKLMVTHNIKTNGGDTGSICAYPKC